MPFELRQYQKDAIQAVITDLPDYRKLGLIMPTGSGKTEIFIEIANRYIQSHPHERVLILSHLSILTEQTARRFKSRAPHLATGILQAGKYPNNSDTIVIGTMQTGRAKTHADILNHLSQDRIGLVIIDEAHMLHCESYEKALSYFPTAKIVGCTATPFRSSSIMTNWFDKISYSLSLQKLIEQGHLVPPMLNQITKRGNDIEEISEIIMSIYNGNEKGNNAIVYLQTIEDCKTLRNVFTDYGIKSSAITSQLTGDRREKILDSFRMGHTKVLITVNVLSMGFDSPNIKAIFLPYATSSPTQYLQRIGRGLRTNGDKKYCSVYVFGDAPSISSKLYEKLQKRVLNKGGDPVEYDTYEEDLDYNDRDTKSEEYQWNEKIVKIVKRLRKLGHQKLSDILNQKKFPPKFMKNITDLIDKIPAKSKYQVKIATPAQTELLLRNDFNPMDLDGLTKNEASAIIAIILTGKERPENSQFLLPTGMHQGKYIWQTPHAYRSNILRKYPASKIGQIIRAWNNRNKHA